MSFKFFTIKDKLPENPDCFIVLSYTVKDKNNPTKPTKAIIDLIAKWLKKFPKAKVIMSTGDNQNLGVSNAEVMKRYAVSIGIPEKNILLEDKSKNTYENLVFSKIIVEENHLLRPTLAFYDLHSRRTIAIANKLKWNVNWISAYSKGEPAYGNKSFQTSCRPAIFSYEVLAMIYSKMVGWS